MSNWQSIQLLERSLIVSCQASPGEPLCSPSHILALSQSAIAGGAKALRLEGTKNIHYVSAKATVPIIGLVKAKEMTDMERLEKVYITSTFAEATSVAEAGADIIAIDATTRPRPDGLTLEALIDKIHTVLKKPVWADISSLEEGITAQRYGADIVSTTLFGYTKATAQPPEVGPNFELLQVLIEHLTAPVVLEGRVWHPHEVQRAFQLGAYACVVGSAITRPILITKRFVDAISQT